MAWAILNLAALTSAVALLIGGKVGTATALHGATASSRVCWGCSTC